MSSGLRAVAWEASWAAAGVRAKEDCSEEPSCETTALCTALTQVWRNTLMLQCVKALRLVLKENKFSLRRELLPMPHYLPYAAATTFPGDLRHPQEIFALCMVHSHTNQLPY